MKPRFKHEVPLDLTVPPPPQPKYVEPAPKPKYHGDECFCTSCADIRAAMDIYLENKRLFDINGFN